MRYLIMAITIVVVLAVAVFAFRRWPRRRSVSDYRIHLCIPFATTPELDADTIMRKFKKEWRMEVACGETLGLRDTRHAGATYLIGDGTHNVRLTVSQQPLPGSLLYVTSDGRPGLDDSDKRALRDHRRFVLADYLVGPESPVEQVPWIRITFLVNSSMDWSEKSEV